MKELNEITLTRLMSSKKYYFHLWSILSLETILFVEDSKSHPWLSSFCFEICIFLLHFKYICYSVFLQISFSWYLVVSVPWERHCGSKNFLYPPKFKCFSDSSTEIIQRLCDSYLWFFISSILSSFHIPLCLRRQQCMLIFPWFLELLQHPTFLGCLVCLLPQVFPSYSPSVSICLFVSLVESNTSIFFYGFNNSTILLIMLPSNDNLIKLSQGQVT
jgi:hypothetical protein